MKSLNIRKCQSEKVFGKKCTGIAIIPVRMKPLSEMLDNGTWRVDVCSKCAQELLEQGDWAKVAISA